MFQKLRESALAYHLTRKWPKEKILTEYLNTMYFGNGAYGVESAARTYFGSRAHHAAAASARHDVRLGARARTRPRCSPASSPRPAPTTRSPTPGAPRRGATWCCARCSSRSCSPRRSTTTRSPSRSRPRQTSAAGRTPTQRVLHDWVRQQLVDRVGPPEGPFEGGLR